MEATRALLVIDVQQVYFGGTLTVTHPPHHFERILRAMDAASAARVPVIIVQHSAPTKLSAAFAKGSRTWELHPEVARRPRAHIIEKALPGSFTGTDLEAWLRAHKIDTVVISGYMTQMCCDTTARQAVHLGFKVEFLADATGTLAFENAAGAVTAEELHRAALVVQQSRFAEVLTVEEWAKRLFASGETLGAAAE